MKPLPPTLRENRRYVLIKIFGIDAPNQKEIYYAVSDAVTQLFGDVGSAEMHPAVVWSENSYAIIRCTRGFEQQLIAAISCVTKLSGQKTVFRTLRTSGTIHGVKKGMEFSKSSVLCSED